MSTEPKSYDWRVTAKKVAVLAIGAFVIALVAAWQSIAATGFTGTLWEMLHNRAMLLIAVAAVYKALDNFRKNGPDGKPRWEWPWGNFLPFCLVVCLAAVVAGCSTQKITRLETQPDGTSYRDTYSARSIPILGGVTWMMFGIEYVFTGAAVLAAIAAVCASFVRIPEKPSGEALVGPITET